MKKFMNILLKNKRIALLLAILIGITIIYPFLGDNYTDKPQEKKEDVNQLEKRLTDILSKIDGAGKVDVMVTLHSEGEKLILKDSTDSKSGLSFGNDAVNGEKTVMQKDGSKEQPFVRKITKAEIRGVIVCADGADNQKTKNEIISACTAVLDVPVTRVSVVKRKRG